MPVIDASDLSVFARLSGGQIGRLAAAFESAKSESEAKAREIAGEDFADADIDRIVRSFHVFLGGADMTDLRRLVSSSSLDAEKTSIVLAAADGMLGGSGAERPGRAANAGPKTGAQRVSERDARASGDGAGERSGYSQKSRDLLSLFGLKPGKNPPPTIRGMLEGYSIDKDSLTLVREMRGG